MKLIQPRRHPLSRNDRPHSPRSAATKEKGPAQKPRPTYHFSLTTRSYFFTGALDGGTTPFMRRYVTI